MVVDAEGQKDSWRVYYIPAAGMLVGTSEVGTVHWMRVPAGSEQAFADVVRGPEPFPKPDLTGATVGDRAVAGDPTSYLGLYEVGTAGAAVPQDGDWIPIELRSAEPSPWTTGDNYLVYSPSGKLLQRGGELIRLPDSIAADVENATAIGADGRSLLPWLVLGGVLAALLALAALGALARRRWSAPATSPKAVSA